MYLYESDTVGLTLSETTGRIFISDKTVECNLFVINILPL